MILPTAKDIQELDDYFTILMKLSIEAERWGKESSASKPVGFFAKLVGNDPRTNLAKTRQSISAVISDMANLQYKLFGVKPTQQRLSMEGRTVAVQRAQSVWNDMKAVLTTKATDMQLITAATKLRQEFDKIPV